MYLVSSKFVFTCAMFLRRVIFSRGWWLLVSAVVPTSIHAELINQASTVISYRLPSEDWISASGRIQNDPDWQRWLLRMQRGVDSWIERKAERPDLIAGVIHDYVDPKSQIPLVWTPESPEPLIAGPAHDAWVAYMRLHNIQRIRDAVRLFKLTGKVEYANWASDQLDFYANNYNKWPERTKWGRARMMVQPLDEAMAIMHLADAFRLLKGYAAPLRLKRWESDLFVPIAENLRGSNLGLSNVSLWISSALATIGLELKREDYIVEAFDGPRGLHKLLRDGLGGDGIWLEGSFGYNNYVLRALVPMFISAGLNSRIYLVVGLMNKARQMLLTPYSLVFDDGWLPNPSDSTVRFRPDDPYIHLEYYRVLASEEGVRSAKRLWSWDTLIDPIRENELLPKDGLHPVRTKLFPNVQMAVLKNSPWQLFLRYGHATYKHAQAEALNTEVYYKATPVVKDPGAVAYGSRLQAEYFSRGAAHNVPLVDGLGQESWSSGNVTLFSEEMNAIAVVQNLYRHDAKASKSISFANDELVERTEISLPGDGPNRRLGFVFNTECKVEVPETLNPSSVASLPPVGEGMQYWSDLKSVRISSALYVSLICDGQSIRAKFTIDGDGVMYYGKAPNTPMPTKRDVIYFEKTGRSANFEVRLSPI